MITITVLKSGIENYFLGIANPDYYTGGGEPPGRWYGRGAEALGLSGQVHKEAFVRILSGAAPDGKALEIVRRSKPATMISAISRAGRTKRVPGYDLCFSAPKSVSVVWAVGPRHVREAIEEAFDASVKQTLDWAAQNLPLCRRGRAGRDEQLADLVIAMFDHSTSRFSQKGDWQPQLHRHCVVANIARGSTDGRWSRVNSRRLHEWARTLGPMFRAVLAAELTRRLDVLLVQPTGEDGRRATWFEIKGVAPELCKRWSSRRQEIEELLTADEGLGSASDAAARERANLMTRKSKSTLPARSKLLSQWEAVAKEYGVTPESLERRSDREKSPIPREEAFATCWKEAIATIEASQSTFKERDVVKGVCEAAQALGISGVWLADKVRTTLSANRDIRCLGVLAGEKHYVTNDMWQREEKLLGNFAELRSRPGVYVHEEVITSVVGAHRLSEEQQEAVRDILNGEGSVRILAGVAGSGKSTTLAAIREAMEGTGFVVHGAALAGTATEELSQKAGIPSRTIASHLHRLENQLAPPDDEKRPFNKEPRDSIPSPPSEIKPEDVLIVDEAGMVDAGTMLRLTEAAKALGLTLILVGDARQIQPILPGAPFKHLLEKEKAATLASNLRQQDPEDRRAAEDLRAGDAASALRNYAERGRLKVTEDRAEALQELVATWTKAGGTSKPQDHVIFTGTRAEARAANRLAQREREEVDAIDSSISLRHEGERICLHDRVLIHKNVFADGVRNGYRGEVIAIDPFLKRITIRLDGADARHVSIRLADYENHGLTLNYAQTTHKGQGQSVEHAYLLVGGKMADRELAYVQATRARLSTHVFVDQAHAGEDLEELANSLSRSRAKELAHDVAERIRRRRVEHHERGL